ncbi:aldose 1-epimerase [Puia dinghuensis]|uniref:Aldose 1-epimerase n=1 Tax=Puia dinghuensis TaxID=1792502 RepID=A0A8J2XU55_9BACT|nr:aldose 1-epimerase [Puia dinghuensis]GGB08866.1 aldose 1-epimerase [Puia dinghuensis]
MNFSIRHAKENDLDLINLIDNDSGTTISILPGYGAILHAFHIRLKDGSLYNVIDNYHDGSELKRELSRSFKGPKLSPFPCRIPDGVYHFDGQEYRFAHLFGDGTAIHGLLFDKPFTVIEENAGDSGATVSMQYSYVKDDPGYPFLYTCIVSYRLHPGNTLEVVTTVTNDDQETIPIADGWHPYWRLGGKADDWQLQFHAAAIVDFDQRLVPTGSLTPYQVFETARLLGDTFLDNCFALRPGLVSAACELYNPANGLQVSFFPDATFPYLQIYTPNTRDSIAVENLSGAPDCFNNNMGLLLLQPGHSQIFTVRYKVSVD